MRGQDTKRSGRRHLIRRGFAVPPSHRGEGFFSLRENDRDRRAAARLALQLHPGVMELRAVLDDGQTQTRAAHLFAVALIHPVEPLSLIHI